jgi:hypothetical protein
MKALAIVMSQNFIQKKFERWQRLQSNSIPLESPFFKEGILLQELDPSLEKRGTGDF